MDREKEYQRRVEIVKKFIDRIRDKYQIDSWGISGSTARGDFSSQSDIDIFIGLSIPDSAMSDERKRQWEEFQKWVEPIIEEFQKKYGVDIDLNW